MPRPGRRANRPDDLHLRLRQLARQVDRPQAELIREALVQYLATFDRRHFDVVAREAPIRLVPD